jgi:hypothetical protein
MEMPARILPDHDYVFHHASPFDEAEFARTVLPKQLEKLGFSVTKAVDAGQGFVAIGPVCSFCSRRLFGIDWQPCLSGFDEAAALSELALAAVGLYTRSPRQLQRKRLRKPSCRAVGSV